MKSHWLRPLVSDTMPHRQIFWDVEGVRHTNLDRTHDTFRCASALLVESRSDHDHKPHEELFSTTDAQEFAEWIDSRARSGVTTQLLAHYQDYDLWTSSIIDRLTDMGWTSGQPGVSDKILWIKMHKGNKRLLFANTAPLIKVPLETIAKWWHVKYRHLPKQTAKPIRWRHRCEQDVRLLRRAVEHIQRFWQSEGLGRWGVTSASLCWTAYRRRFVEHKLLVTHEPEYNKLERDAYFAGRAEIFRHGYIDDYPITEVDITQCFGHIMATAKLPRRPVGHGHGMSMETYQRLGGRTGTIAEVEITTDVPCVPCRTHNGIAYPVRTFRTTLCTPEIDLALEHGAEIRFLHYALYSMWPIAQRFGAWRQDQLEQAEAREDWLIASLMKRWGRELCGKFGQREAHWHDLGQGTDRTLKVIQYRDAGSTIMTPILQMGGHRYAQIKGDNAENAMPAVAAWVNSLARVQLWQLIVTAGRENVLYCDTDCVHVTRAGLERLQPSLRVNEPGAPRTKAVWGRACYILPKIYEVDGQMFAKGIPIARRAVGLHRFEVIRSPGFMYQATHSKKGQWQRIPTTMNIHRQYLRGWCLRDGTVVPLVCTVHRGKTAIVPWREARGRYPGTKLANRKQSSLVIRGP